MQKGKPHKAGEEFTTWGERGPGKLLAKGVSTHPKTSSQFLEASDSLPSSSSINAQMLTRKVVKIAVMNLQSDPLGVQGGPNRDTHVIWKLVTLLNEGNWAARKTVARCRLGARCRDPSQTSLSPSLHQPSNPSSQQHAPLSHLSPHHRTHCAPDSPAHDDLGAEGEGGVSPIAVADARGQNTGIATGVHKDVMHHRLVVGDQLGLKLRRGGREGKA